MEVNEFIFTKHEYEIICKCGHRKTNNDAGFIKEVGMVKVDCCRQCCPQYAGAPIQIPYTSDGERIYT